jgi:uncharacterized membrane protein YeaQ/YmgE (transglycosylase-associated protein family)
MYFIYWIVAGWITGWLTGGRLTGNGYGPIMDAVMGIAGGVAGGYIVRLSISPALGGLLLTVPAAMLGAFILTAMTAYANGRRTFVNPLATIRESAD